MKTPLSLSKITPPQFPHVLQRPRLLELLHHNCDKKLILILGQAAQGKSTLAVSWVDRATEPVAWVNLGPEDADPVNLFYLLVDSLQMAVPALDLSPLFSYPSMILGPREEIPLYQDWSRSLYRLLPTPVRLILDGLDQVPQESGAYRFLAVLLGEAPPGFHYIILSREVPPLNLQTLMMRQEAFILGNEELAFSLKETREFLKVRRLRLPEDAVKQVFGLTEGWAGGLVLLCGGLERLPETAREEYLRSDLTEKFTGDVFNYFSEQVFAALPPATQEFLVKSTILEVVAPDFIKHFLGMNNAGEILEDLARRNLFIQSIHDRKRGWLYRYHLLFRDFLYVKFKARLGEEQQQAAYFRAGVLSEEREETEQALKYYLEARAYPEAAAALVKVGLPLIVAGRTMDLTQWLVAIPDEIIQNNPWLLFYRYVSARFTGPPEILADLQRARAIFQEQGEVRGSLLAMAYLLEATSLRTHKIIGPIQVLLEQGEALAQSGSAQPYTVERALLLSHLGFTSYLRGGVPLKSAWACRQAYLLTRNLGNVFLQALALHHEYVAYILLGEFPRFENLVKQLDKIFDKFFFPELHSLHLINLGQKYLFQGEAFKAASYLEQARDKIERHGLIYLYPPILMCELWSKVYLAEGQDTEESARAIANLSLTMGNVFVQGLSLLMLGASRYQRGNFRGAQEVLRQAWEILGSEEGRAELQWNWTKVLLALVASHLQENGAAERGLEEALEHFNLSSSQTFLREAHLATALWKWRQGQTTEVVCHLETGLKLLERHGYHFSFMLNKQDMLQVCLLALELQMEGTWDYVSCILKTRLADIAGPELEKLLYHPEKRVAERAWEIRRAIHRDRKPRVRLQTLGGFLLWRGETAMAEDDWEGHQPQLLFKALLAHGAHGVVKDVLLEDLWPEADPEGAEKNFKVNLHRLRKSLEPDLNKTFGSSYIHLKANLVSVDAELCNLDVENFLVGVKEGEKKEAQGQVKEAVVLYKDAVASYSGDFLPEERYFPWVDAERERLRQTYLGLLHRLARLYEKQGALTRAIDCYKRLLDSDLLDEPACQHLMLLYAQKGRRSAALKVYQDCCLALKKELNTEPDEVTRAIYQKILTSP